MYFESVFEDESMKHNMLAFFKVILFTKDSPSDSMYIQRTELNQVLCWTALEFPSDFKNATR